MDQLKALQKSRKRIKETINDYTLSKRLKHYEDESRNYKQSHFETIMEYARNGDRQTLQNHLNTGTLSSINLYNCERLTLLIKACEEGRIDCVILFLELGADMSSCYRGDFVALNIACRYGHFDLVKLLLMKGAKVNNFNSRTGSALMAACEGGRLELVKHLLNLGATVNDVGGSFGTALRAACFYGNIDVIDTLIAYGADVNLTDECGTTALMAACGSKRLEAVRVMMEYKADLTAVDVYGNTALTIACGHDATAMLELLLQCEVDVNVLVDIEGFRGTVLCYACYKGSVDIVRLLVNHGALVDATDSRGDTVLISLCRRGGKSIDTVRVLLDLHADVHKTDRRCLTPLMIASASGSRCVVDALLDGGAFVDAVDDFECTALFHAATREVAELLVSRGADIDLVSKYRGSVLYSASVSDKWDVVELLLEHDADLMGDGVTILTWARRCHQLKVVELMMAREIIKPLSSADVARLSEDSSSYPDISKIMAAKEPINVEAYKEGTASITYGIVCARISSGDIKSFRGATREAFILATNYANKHHSYQSLGNALSTAYAQGRIDVIELLLKYGSAGDDVTLFDAACAYILVEACLAGQFDVVKLLLEYGVKVNSVDKFERTALVAACYPKNSEYSKCDYSYRALKYHSPPAPASSPIDLVKLLLMHGASINQKCKCFTPLIAATLAGDIESVRLLLRKGADVKAVSPRCDEPAIHFACRQGSIDILKLLRSYGAGLSTKTAPALALASMHGHLELVKWLLEFGAKVDADVLVVEKVMTPLSCACKHGHIDVAQHLLSVGATLPPSLLLELCEKGSLDVLKLLVEHGASVNAILDASGRSPLHIACYYSRLDVVTWLLESGADVATLDKGGKDALALTNKHCSYDNVNEAAILQALLQRGAGLNADTAYVLTRAFTYGYTEVLDLLLKRRAPGAETKSLSDRLNDAYLPLSAANVKVLLKYGATVAEADEGREFTCLLRAVHNNSIETATLLLDNGADVNRAGSALRTPLMSACTEGHLKLAKMLLTHGAEIDAVDAEGNTALLLVASSGKIDMLKLLITNGADVNKANYAGDTPLIRAAEGKKKGNRLGPLFEAGADVTATNSQGKTVLDYLEHNQTLYELCQSYVDKNRGSLQPILK